MKCSSLVGWDTMKTSITVNIEFVACIWNFSGCKFVSALLYGASSVQYAKVTNSAATELMLNNIHMVA